MRIIKRISAVSAGVLAFSLFCHGNAVLYWLTLPQPFVPYPGFDEAFPFLLAASFALSVAMFLLEDLRLFRFVLFLRFLVYITAFNPFGADAAIGLSPLLAMMLEVSVYEEFPRNLAIGSALAAACTLTRLWTVTGAAAARWAAPLACQALAAEGAAAAGSLLTYHRQKVIRLTRETVKLGKAVADLAEASRGYLEVAHATEERSARDERNRITRELHDTIGYAFTNLNMMLAAAKALAGVDRERLESLLDEAREQAQRGLAETRNVLYLLRERSLREPEGLAAVHRLVKTFQSATGVSVLVEYTNMPLSSGEDVDSFILHFVQEGLTNSFRHGRASTIRLKFWKEADCIRVCLWDNGIGTDAVVEGIGMLGMRERLGKLGGTLEARNVVDGFEVSAEIPRKGA